MMIATDARYLALRRIIDLYRASGAGARLFSSGELTADERAQATTAIDAGLEAARIALARHEAAHAVVALGYGVYIKSVSICPEWVECRGDGKVYQAGRVITGDTRCCSDLEMAIFYAAGPLAEEALTGELALPDFGGSDRQSIKSLLSEQRLIDIAFSEARGLVRLRATDIARVADELLTRETMTGRAVADIVEGRA